MIGESVLFTVFALATCLSAVAVVLSQTVVRMAFWLIITLGSTSALFFLANADFIGAAQLLVYVGGTLVLLVFGVMLTASGPYLKIATSPGETIVAGMLGLLFLFMVFSTVGGVDWSTGMTVADTAETAGNSPGDTLRPIGLSLFGLRPDVDINESGVSSGAGYLLPFEIVSVHLLVVLIGAAYLARAKRHRPSSLSRDSV